jgi:hypothetical protein
MHARLDAGRVKIITRRGNDWTQKYPAIAKAIAGLPAQDAYLDGELCGVLPDGRTAFNLIQYAADASQGSLVFFLFDLLFLDGEDIRDLPLVDRKARLEAFLVGAPRSLRYNDHQIGQGPAFHRLACEHGLEGIVSKRIDGRYEPDLRTWRKTKCLNREEFIVVGWSDPEGQSASDRRVAAGLLHAGWQAGLRAGLAPVYPSPSLSACSSVFIRSRSPECLSPHRRRAVVVSAHRWCCRGCIGCARRWSSRSATRSGRLTVCSGMSFIWGSARTSQRSMYDEIDQTLKVIYRGNTSRSVYERKGMPDTTTLAFASGTPAFANAPMKAAYTAIPRPAVVILERSNRVFRC